MALTMVLLILTYLVVQNVKSTHLWSNGETTEDLNNISAGTYSVTVTDSNGCQVSSIVEIIESDEIDITYLNADYSGYGVSCNGASDGSIDVTVTGGTGNYTYSWNNGETTEDLSDLSAGTYTLTVTDDNGCQKIPLLKLQKLKILLLPKLIPTTLVLEHHVTGRVTEQLI